MREPIKGYGQGQQENMSFQMNGILIAFVVVFLNGSGTHAREFRGKSPTNKRVNIRSADLYKIENEKIVEHWDIVDQLNLLHQTSTTLS